MLYVPILTGVKCAGITIPGMASWVTRNGLLAGNEWIKHQAS